jgi:hypothetical protein
MADTSHWVAAWVDHMAAGLGDAVAAHAIEEDWRSNSITIRIGLAEYRDEVWVAIHRNFDELARQIAEVDPDTTLDLDIDIQSVEEGSQWMV